MIFLALLCSVILWPLTAYFVSGLVRQASTGEWPSARGEVLSSRVTSHRGSKGSRTYRPEVAYRYSIAGANYTGSNITLSKTFGDSGGGYARRTVAQFPAGRQTDVYYNPEAPEESVLLRGIGDREWQVLSLVSILVSVPVILWIVVAAGFRSRSRGRVGTVRVLEPTPGIAVVRDYDFGPLGVAAAAWAIGLLGTLLAVTLVFDTGLRDVLLIGWGVTLLLTAGSAWLRSRWINAGRCDTVIDQAAGVLIPARGGKGAAQAVPLTGVTGTKLKQDSPHSTNKRPHWRVHVVLAGEGRTMPVADVRLKEDARAFDRWLRARLGLTGAPDAVID